MTARAYEKVTDDGFGLCDASKTSATLVLSIAVLALPAAHTLVLDGATRRVLFSGPTTNGVEVDGSAYIDASGGFIQWATLACRTNTVIQVNTTANTGFSYTPPLVLVELIKRGGC